MAENPPENAPQTRPQAEPEVDWKDLFKRLGGIGPLAIMAATLPALGGFVLLAYSQTVGEWLRSHGESGPFLYAAGFAILAGFALLPTYAQAIVGGFAFGAIKGTIAALAGFVGAALIGYTIARYISGNRAEDVIAEHPRWKAVHDELLRGGFWKTLGIVILIRVPPNSPFAMTNLIMAATQVPWLSYALGTLIGMAPRTAAAVYIGSTLSNLDEIERPWWVIWGGIAVAIVVVIIVGWLANRAIARLGVTEERVQTP